MIKRISLALLAAGVLSSCSMAPDYIRPDAPIENQFPGKADDASAKTPGHPDRMERILSRTAFEGPDCRSY